MATLLEPCVKIWRNCFLWKQEFYKRIFRKKNIFEVENLRKFATKKIRNAVCAVRGSRSHRRDFVTVSRARARARERALSARSRELRLRVPVLYLHNRTNNSCAAAVAESGNLASRSVLVVQVDITEERGSQLIGWETATCRKDLVLLLSSSSCRSSFTQLRNCEICVPGFSRFLWSESVSCFFFFLG